MEKEELEYRLRQQALVADLGLHALNHRDLPSLAEEAARVAAEGLRSSLAKVAQYLPDENRLLVLAGVGWKERVVGTATIGADLESTAESLRTSAEPTMPRWPATHTRLPRRE